MREVFSSRPYLGSDPNAIYRILKYMPVEHIVDVGAAAGGTVKLAKRSAPNAKVTAFEPFPGNFDLFHLETKDLNDVTFHKCAVSSRPGLRHLHVAKKVAGTEPGWENKIGYSSGSRLVPDATSQNSIEIRAVKIDDEIVGRISFLKIDVQGTERDVLESAREKFNGQEIDLCFVEFNAEVEIADFLFDYGFNIFYTPILIAGGPIIGEEDPDFSVVARKNMSNGNIGQCVWDRRMPCGIEHFSDRINYLKDQFKCSVQTDLICVSPNFMAEFLISSSKFYKHEALIFK